MHRPLLVRERVDDLDRVNPYQDAAEQVRIYVATFPREETEVEEILQPNTRT